jgi:hypothetical protein
VYHPFSDCPCKRLFPLSDWLSGRRPISHTKSPPLGDMSFPRSDQSKKALFIRLERGGRFSRQFICIRLETKHERTAAFRGTREKTITSVEGSKSEALGKQIQTTRTPLPLSQSKRQCSAQKSSADSFRSSQISSILAASPDSRSTSLAE